MAIRCCIAKLTSCSTSCPMPTPTAHAKSTWKRSLQFRCSSSTILECASCHTRLPTFSVDQDTGLRLKYHILHSKSHQLRDSEATRETKMKHCPVTDAVPTSWVRGIQN